MTAARPIVTPTGDACTNFDFGEVIIPVAVLRSMGARTAFVFTCCAACAGGGEPESARAASFDTLSARPMAVIGVESGDDAQVLAQVFSGFRGRDGLVVANGAPPEIRVYGSTGEVIRRIGREGGGPGEFRRLTWIAALGGDSIAALDAAASRITVFGPTGAYVRTVSVEAAEYGGAEWLGVTGEGFALGVAQRADPRQLQIGGIARDSFGVVFLSSTGAPLGAGPRVGGQWWRREAADDGVRIRSLEWRTRALVGGTEGSVVLSASDSPEVLLWRGGAWDTVRVDLPREVRPDAPATAFRDEIAIGAAGALWVADTLIGVDGLRRWRVFDTAGVIRAVVRLPAAFRVWQVGADWVLGRSLSAEDVEQVQLWALERRP